VRSLYRLTHCNLVVGRIEDEYASDLSILLKPPRTPSEEHFLPTFLSPQTFGQRDKGREEAAARERKGRGGRTCVGLG
jgi:hypothetical protein